MMGRTHAASGLAVAAFVATVTNAPPLDALALFIGVPGFALLPDIDHPKSLAGRSLGGLSGIPGRLLRHRRETHSFFGVSVFTALTAVAVWAGDHWAALAWLWFIVAVASLSALRAFGLTTRRSVWLPVAALVGATYVAANASWTLPVAVATGMLIHIFGDVVTRGGCPLLWPFTSRRFQLNWFRTNSPVETLFLWAFVVISFIGIGSYAAVAYATLPGSHP